MTLHDGNAAASIAALPAGTAPAELAAALLEAAAGLVEPVSIKDIASGCYRFLNAPMAALLGGPTAPAASLVGRTDGELLDAAFCARLRAADDAAATGTGLHVGEHLVDCDGGRRTFTVVRRALAPAYAGAPRLLLAVWSETTGERRTQALLQRALAQIEEQQQASLTARQNADAPQPGVRDPLTGLCDSAQFGDQLRREVDLSLREHREFALVAVSLDPLPDRTAALGAPARTQVLEALGRLLAGNTRAMDGACKLADDRFAILLSGVGLATAHSRMEGVRRQCATQIVVHEGRTIGFTVSMGVASFPHTADTRQDVFAAAENALAEAQRRGGNHVTLASIRFEPAG